MYVAVGILSLCAQELEIPMDYVILPYASIGHAKLVKHADWYTRSGYTLTVYNYQDWEVWMK